MYIKVNGVEKFNMPVRASFSVPFTQCPASFFKASRNGRKR